ncbi:MAG: hypothetical protein AB1725_06045 [Armatimonadota bacterium]
MNLKPSVRVTLEELARRAPGAPLLALGQTVFWDEPMKALVLKAAEELGLPLELIAGVHDTDYFAKLPGGGEAVDRLDKGFVALPKNDGSTKEFWSAAGEFSALFGGETPVTRERLLEAGVNIEMVTHGQAEMLDQITEAYGWRGIASTSERTMTTAEIPTSAVFPCLQKTFQWALDLTVGCMCLPEERARSEDAATRLQELLCRVRERCYEKEVSAGVERAGASGAGAETLAALYECLLPELQSAVAGVSSKKITRTSSLLRFAPDTAGLPRFRILDLFLQPDTAAAARRAYDVAVQGTQTYTLDKFGTGAVPFDLVIPGHGRGTIRLTPKVMVVMTPKPVFVNLAKPVESVHDLAAVCSEHFADCVLVGKAITLISMLAREFVFAFHENASMYVSSTREMHDELRAAGIEHDVNPILRIRLETWDALDGTAHWFELPEPLRLPFGADHLPARTLARTWRKVQAKELKHIQTLKSAKSTTQAIRALHQVMGGCWDALGKEYAEIRRTLRAIRQRLASLERDVRKTHTRLREIKREWQEVEKAKGEHFRTKIQPSPEDAPSQELQKRGAFDQRIAALRAERKELRARLQEIRDKQARMASTEEAVRARTRREEIQREVQLARVKVVRGAVIATHGLSRCNHRPSAWWFPVVSPNGEWAENVYKGMEMRLEELN